jgi:hypothetical protein
VAVPERGVGAEVLNGIGKEIEQLTESRGGMIGTETLNLKIGVVMIEGIETGIGKGIQDETEKETMIDAIGTGKAKDDGIEVVKGGDVGSCE